jgi:hypothetical protein
MSTCRWKNGANKIARRKVASNLQFIKNAISVKRNKAKRNKTRYACIVLSLTNKCVFIIHTGLSPLINKKNIGYYIVLSEFL